MKCLKLCLNIYKVIITLPINLPESVPGVTKESSPMSHPMGSGTYGLNDIVPTSVRCLLNKSSDIGPIYITIIVF